MNIYVGNLPFAATEEDVKTAFEAYGQVETVKVIKDNYTGASKGFCFVEMPNNFFPFETNKRGNRLC